MNDRLTMAIRTWAKQFPNAESNHFVFPAEQYGAPGDKKLGTFNADPTKAIRSWKTAWKNARHTTMSSVAFMT